MSSKLTLAQLVQALRVDQRQRWHEHERVPAEAYFDYVPAFQADINYALELVYNEVLLREEQGETPQLEEYLRRFPQFATQLPPLFEVHRALETGQVLEVTPPNLAPEMPS